MRGGVANLEEVLGLVAGEQLDGLLLDDDFSLAHRSLGGHAVRVVEDVGGVTATRGEGERDGGHRGGALHEGTPGGRNPTNRRGEHRATGGCASHTLGEDHRGSARTDAAHHCSNDNE